MKRVAVAFTGPSNSGKTTLIKKIAESLIKEYRVAIIKHDPKDKAKFDVEGKDSYKFSSLGADTVVLSPTRTTYFIKKSHSLDEIVNRLGEFNILLIEGLKDSSVTTIAIFRDKIDKSYLKFCDAVATDKSVDIDRDDIKKEILDLNSIDTIIKWIKKNGKNI